MIGCNTVVVRRYEVEIHVREPLAPRADPIAEIEVVTIVCSIQ